MFRNTGGVIVRKGEVGAGGYMLYLVDGRVGQVKLLPQLETIVPEFISLSCYVEQSNNQQQEQRHSMLPHSLDNGLAEYCTGGYRTGGL